MTLRGAKIGQSQQNMGNVSTICVGLREICVIALRDVT
jgi:hypothetical protein